jgi:hypothetical protein
MSINAEEYASRFQRVISGKGSSTDYAWMMGKLKGVNKSSWGPRISTCDIIQWHFTPAEYLSDRGVPPVFANSFPERFNFAEIAEFYDAKPRIYPLDALKYHEKFNGNDIRVYLTHKPPIASEQAEPYDYLYPNDIVAFIDNSVKAEYANIVKPYMTEERPTQFYQTYYDTKYFEDWLRVDTLQLLLGETLDVVKAHTENKDAMLIEELADEHLLLKVLTMQVQPPEYTSWGYLTEGVALSRDQAIALAKLRQSGNNETVYAKHLYIGKSMTVVYDDEEIRLTNSTNPYRVSDFFKGQTSYLSFVTKSNIPKYYEDLRNLVNDLIEREKEFNAIVREHNKVHTKMVEKGD